MIVIVTLFVVHWMASGFFQSSFLHRYASHRMFTMTPRVEKVFHLLTYVSQGPSYLTPRAYALLHREHHAYSDTARDPHAPRFFKNVFTMMWSTAERYTAHVKGMARVEGRFLGGYPEWPLLDRLGSTWAARLAWGVFYVVIYVWLAPHWLFFFLLPAHWFMGPIHGAIVNWCGHRYGYRNFTTNDESRNFLPLDFLTWGELFQNNHHRASGRLNFAVRRFEFDPGAAMLRLLARLRVIQLHAGALGPIPA